MLFGRVYNFVVEGRIDNKTGDFWLLVSPNEVAENKLSPNEDPLLWSCRLVALVGETRLLLLGLERGLEIPDMTVVDRFNLDIPQATVYLNSQGFNLLEKQGKIGARFGNASKATVLMASSWEEAWEQQRS